MKKISTSSSGIFTIKEYEMEEGQDFVSLVKQLCAGPEPVQEIIPYVFEGDDPLGIDANPVSAGDFVKMYPGLKGYGEGLAFDVIVRREEGHPVTVELTEGSRIIAINTLDQDAEIDDLLGAPSAETGADTDAKEADLTAETGMGTDAEEADLTAETGTDTAVKEADLTAETGADADAIETDSSAGTNDLDSQGMSPDTFLKILSVAERLKCSTRHCDTSSGRRESVAEHSWRTALMAMLLSSSGQFDGIDLDRVIRMCLIHDLGEAFTGDIPTFEKSGKDEETEYRELTGWIGTFPETLKKEFEELFAEMQERKTPEARLFKALDKLEAVIQHNESDISSWLPLEYDLQFTYGKEEAGQFPYLKQLRDRIDLWTKEKIDNAQNDV